MPIKRIGWFSEWEVEHWSPSSWKSEWGPKPTEFHESMDLHVIRGATTQPLRPMLMFFEPIDNEPNRFFFFHEGDAKLTSFPNRIEAKSITFVPRLAPAAMVDHAGVLEGLGVRVDTKTGEVTAISPAPAGRLVRNFLLDAIVKIERSSGVFEELNRLTLRVHVYDRLVDAWITPSRLTVHRGSPIRPTVLASFALDNEPAPPLAGDVTRLAGLSWSSNDPSVTFDALARIQTTTVGTFTISAKLPAAWGGKLIQSQIDVVDAWADKSNVRATLLAGPGSAKLEEVPNVLLIPDGFTPDQEDDWNTLVAEVIDDMMKHQIGRPFDLFLNNGSLNVWSVFLPSREAGASALYEMKTYDQDGKTLGFTISDASDPPKAGQFGVAQINGFGGLPVRSDALPDDPQAQQQKWKDKLDEWRAIFGPVTAGNVQFLTWKAWTDGSARTLVDERDTALGVAFGARPAFTSWTPDRVVTHHPLRTRRVHMDQWLARLQDDDGPVIGHVWGNPDAKDYSYVMVLLGGARWGGADDARGVAAASLQGDPTVVVSRVGAGPRHVIVPFDLPRSFLGSPEIGPEERATITHELAHAFGLQDEYAEWGTRRDTDAKFEDAGNVQPVDELRDPAVAPANRVGDGLVGDRLRWRAPRIARAGVLTQPIVKTGADEYMIPLRKGHKHLFKRGDTVFLRTRPFRRFMKEGTGASAKIVLKLAQVSMPLQVTSDLQVEEQIIVTANGAVFDPKLFTATAPFESIVFVPVPPPPDAAAAHEPWADLVPLVVRQHITKTGLPLDRTTGMKCEDLPPTNRLDGYDARQEIRDPPANVKFHWIYDWVGAFDGGGRYSCGVVHPAAICAMNFSFQRYDNEDIGTYRRIAPFCPVCSYLLVDAIDPNLHGEIDKLYAAGYVEAAP